jgi:hypothetical protein
MGRITPTLLALLIAAALAAPLPTRAAAVFTLSGTVRLASGEPLAGVRVSVAETADNLANALATTRADGSFSVSVPAGTYALTTFAAAAAKSPTDILDRTIYAIDVDASRSVDVVLERGTVVQACVVGAGGAPLPSSRVAVFDALRTNVTTEVADSSGWVRLVLGPGMSVFAMPPAARGREIPRWLRYEELTIDADGVAAPIALDTIPEPETAGDLTTVLAGSAPGRHLAITFVSEGFTDLDEPFVDANGNGVCDDEPFLDLDGDGRYDLGEPFLDANGDGKRTREDFTDTNGDGVCNRGERELFVEAVIDSVRAMLGFPVYRELRDRLDVYAAFVPSRQAGSDFLGITAPIERDTEFGSKFQSRNFVFNIDRDKVGSTAAGMVPETNVAGVVTFSVYGLGRESAGEVTSLFGSRKRDVDFVAAHEFGHAIGKLADEYYEFDGAPPYNRDEPPYPNVTRTSAVAELKWAAFVHGGTALPTPDGVAGVGAFEGGFNRRHGISRPAFDCLMRRFSTFCPVCAEAMYANIAAAVGAERPAAPTLVAPRDGDPPEAFFEAAFDVDDLARVVSARAVVDGAPAGAVSATAPYGVVLDARALGAGRHTIALDVTLASGATVRTAAAAVDCSPRATGAVSLGTARFRGGTLAFEGASGVALPGAAVFVGGADRFPLERTPSGQLRVVKAALGSASGLRIAKAVRKGRPVALRIVNPDGGATDPVTFTR